MVEIIEIDDSDMSTLPVLVEEETPVSSQDYFTEYRLSTYAKEVYQHLQFTEIEWKVFFAFENSCSINSVADMLGLPLPVIVKTVERFVISNILVSEKALSYSQYQSIFSQKEKANIYPSHDENEEVSLVIPINTEVEVKVNESYHAEPVEPQIADASQDSIPVLSNKLRSLRCLVETICRYKGDDRRGKLAVYRIFLRVPREDFVALGFGSFLFIKNRLQEDTQLSPELFDRLVQAAKQELGKHPEAIFNELNAMGKLPQSCTHS